MRKGLGRHNRRSAGGPQPSLVLDFAGTGTLDPRITFTRSTTGTYYNSSGVLSTAAINEARFDYNPSTLAPLGLLIEQSSTNLLTYSQDFSNAAWAGLTSGVTVVGNNATAPDGTTTADTATFTGSSYRYQFINTGTITGVTYTFSVWLSSLTGKDTIGVRLAGASTGSDNNFALATLTTTPTRITVTRTFTSSDTQVIVGLDNRAAVVGGNQTTGNVIVWGAQLEALAFSTSYIPTTSAQVTRAADNASMTGTNFSSWYNTAEGTFYSDVASTNGTNSRAFSTDDGSTSNQIVIGYDTSRVRINNVDVGNFYVGIVITGKRTISYAINQQAASNNGAVVSSTNNGTMPVLTNFRIGSSIALTGILNGAIKKIAYYPTRLTNAQLQALTT